MLHWQEGGKLTSSGVHGLVVCRKFAGRHARHNAVNDLIKRALASANVSSVISAWANLAVQRLWKTPRWSNDAALVWDFTCPGTLTASHVNRAVVSPGAVANDVESWKALKYRSLSATYTFTPVAVETLGPLGDEASQFFRDIGDRNTTATQEQRSHQFLMQRLSVLSVAIQRGIGVCVLCQRL